MAVEGLRRALMYLTYLADLVAPSMPIGPTAAEPLRWVIDFTEGLCPQAHVVLGIIRANNGWILTTDTAKHAMIYHACLYVAMHHLSLSGCLSCTLAHGVKLHPHTVAELSLTMHWICGNPESMQYHQVQGGEEVRVETHLGRERSWNRTCSVQFRMFTQQVVTEYNKKKEKTIQ